jgi:hypothetical protein
MFEARTAFTSKDEGFCKSGLKALLYSSCEIIRT